MSSLARALAIAREAHAGQVDKAGRPHIEHVLRVVDAVEGEDAKIVAALHDVLEDCPEWTVGRLLDQGFTSHLVVDVDTLTRREGLSYSQYIQRIAAWPVARAVKLADLLDNSDPVRLALLPEKDRTRLKKKHAAALVALGVSS